MIPQTGIRRRRLISSWSPLSVIVSAGLQGLADGLLQPVIMLSALAFLLGGSNYQIASFAVIAAACWSLGQFLVEPLVAIAKNTKPIAIAGLILRTGAIVLIGFIGYRLVHLDPKNALTALIICYLAYQLGAMLTAFTTNGQVAFAYAPARRAALFRWRAIAATGAALIAGIVAQSTFGSTEVGFPTSGKYVLLLAAISVIAATWFLIQVPMRSRQHTGVRPAADSHPGALLRSSSMRRYLGFRLLLGLSMLADPFVVIYGMQKLGFSLRYIGLSLACYALLQLLGTLIWPRWLNAHSSIRLLQFAAFLRLIFLVLAFSIPALGVSSFYTDRFDTPTLAGWSFAAIFALLGLSTSIHNAANQRYLIAVSGAHHPMTAISSANALLGILAFAPLGGSWIATRFSIETTIMTGGAIAFLAFIASAMLVESRARISQRRVWRLGNRRPRIAN